MTTVDVQQLARDKIVDIDILSGAVRSDWRPRAAEWACRDPFYVVNDGVAQVIVSRYAQGRELLLATDQFTTEVPKTDGNEVFDMYFGLPDLLHINGESHRRIRRFLQPTLNAAAVRRYEEVIQEEVDGLLDEIEANGPEFDAVADFGGQLIARIFLRWMLRLTPEHRAVFVRMKDAISALGTGGHMQEYIDSFEACRVMINGVIEEREGIESDDFISTLLEARRAGEQITNDEIYAEVFAIGVGSIFPTASATTGMLLARCRFADQFDRLINERELIPSAVEESLRYHPAGIFVIPRFAVEDTDLHGTRIYKDMPVHVSVAAGNLDADEYPDPLTFDIERNPKRILTFGAGPHNCAGALLSRRIMAHSLGAFMQRFPGLRLADPEFELTYQGQIGELAAVSLPMLLS